MIHAGGEAQRYEPPVPEFFGSGGVPQQIGDRVGKSLDLIGSAFGDPAERPDLTVVIGVNDDRLLPEHRIVSNASCTAHAAAPVVKILNDAFGIRKAFLTTVHAYTNQGRLADVPAADKRRGRAAAENIIPQDSNSADVIMELLPELRVRVARLLASVP